MNLLRYIKGLKRGKEAHNIELDAMKDSFLSEALEGYDAIDDNHLKQISYLQKHIKNHKHRQNKAITAKPASKQIPINSKKNIPWKKLRAAVIFLLCLSLGVYFFIENKQSFSKHQPVVLPEYLKKTENVKNEIADTVKLQQDTLVTQDTLINIPPLPLPKKNPVVSAKTLQDNLKVNKREIEVVKLDAPKIQLPTTDTTKLKLLQ